MSRGVQALVGASVAAGLQGCGRGEPLAPPRADAATTERQERVFVQALEPRSAGRPVIAVLARNEGTETTDFQLPHAVLQRAGVSNLKYIASETRLPVPAPPRALFMTPNATLATFVPCHAQEASPQFDGPLGMRSPSVKSEHQVRRGDVGGRKRAAGPVEPEPGVDDRDPHPARYPVRGQELPGLRHLRLAPLVVVALDREAVDARSFVRREHHGVELRDVVQPDVAPRGHLVERESGERRGGRGGYDVLARSSGARDAGCEFLLAGDADATIFEVQVRAAALSGTPAAPHHPA